MPQYYDNEEFDFEANADYSDGDRPGCYPKPYPPCPPAQPTQVAGAQTQQPQANLLYCMPVGQVAGAQTPSLVAGAQSPYNQSPYGGYPGFYPPYPYYGGFGYGVGWVWAVVVIVVILLIICGCWWWFGYR